MVEEAEVRAYTALLSAATLIQKAVDDDLRARTGITQAQFEILARLAAAPDGLRMTDLAKGLILSRSGATYRTQQLAAAGYLTRDQDPDDDRGVIARLTPAGAQVVDAARPGHEALVRRLMFDVLAHDDLERLAVSLESIVRHAGD